LLLSVLLVNPFGVGATKVFQQQHSTWVETQPSALLRGTRTTRSAPYFMPEVYLQMAVNVSQARMAGGTAQGQVADVSCFFL
jgi:hypothetical protein